MEIGNQELYMSTKKPWKRNKNVKALLIMSRKTKLALDAGKDVTHADPIDYEDLKALINAHKKTLFKNAESYQINVLTPIGWRAGYRFPTYREIDWVDWSGYNDKDEDIDEVYAIELLYW